MVFSEWNSSPIVKSTTSSGKKTRSLTPMTFSLIHSADFASRINSQIIPALEAGAIVLADRYVYTAFARDAVRGVSRKWLRQLYSFAVKPHISFYFDVPLDESLRRILTGRPELKYYEAGLDLGLSDDPYESFRLFQGLIREEYNQLVREFDLERIDATDNLIRQQQLVREVVKPYLNGLMRAGNGGLQSALEERNLRGRYLVESGKSGGNPA